MPLDTAVVKALRQAVQEEGQPQIVAEQLQAWLLAVGEGDASVDAQMQIYDVLRQQLTLSEDE